MTRSREDRDTRAGIELTAVQHARLMAWRAWWDESEDRYLHWEMRDRDEETAETLRRILAENDFASGNDLSVPQLDALCRLARRLVPNRNLDRRLYTGPGEPAEFNRLLRRLLYGPGSLPDRLKPLLERKGVGAQTISQLLCAVFPARYPVVTPTALRALELTPEQNRQAATRAMEEYAADDMPPGSPAARLLRDFALFHSVRAALGDRSYMEVHRLLQLAPVEADADSVPVAIVLREERVTYRAEEPTEHDLLAHLETQAVTHGLHYPPLTLRSYYIALKTRPFAILSGVSGTGKTRLTQLFAEAITGDTARQYRLLPVRPDWTDSTALLGYMNLLAGPEGRYVSTRFLDFLREAGRPENAGRAYFVCLDEMNLARVEHYFADLLSAMEMPPHEIPLHGDTVVRIPPNFFVTGTVNVDETTHSFSRKVLDRANTLEFSEVDLSALTVSPPGMTPPSLSPLRCQSLLLGSRLPDVGAAQRRLRGIAPGLVEQALEMLRSLNETLAMAQMLFAYRVRNEALLFLANSFDSQGRGLFAGETAVNYQIAMDFQVCQKILPRLSGTQEQIEGAVRAMLCLFIPAVEPLMNAAMSNLNALERLAEASASPRAARKLARLLARLQRDGYATYFEG